MKFYRLAAGHEDILNTNGKTFFDHITHISFLNLKNIHIIKLIMFETNRTF